MTWIAANWILPPPGEGVLRMKLTKCQSMLSARTIVLDVEELATMLPLAAPLERKVWGEEEEKRTASKEKHR